MRRGAEEDARRIFSEHEPRAPVLHARVIQLQKLAGVHPVVSINEFHRVKQGVGVLVSSVSVGGVPMQPTIRLVALLCCLPLVGGCAIKVVNLTPADPPVSQLAETPFEDTVAVEVLRTTDIGGYEDAAGFQQGLAQALRQGQVFRRVTDPQAANYQVDFVLRGTVGGEFHSSDLLNFITWFPGPFILMHHWRGTRFTYHARADIEIVDARTATVVGRYRVENRHQLMHRSPNPFHGLGAALILPGVLKGVSSLDPREQYRSLLYAAAYSKLWEPLLAQIIADRGPYYADRRRERIERCGTNLNEPPVVGMAWSEFTACQTGRFRPRREEDTPEGRVTVYANEAGSIEVHVRDESIVRWLTSQ